MKPASPEDPASVVRSQLTAWTAELEILSRDPRVRKFAELRQKLDEVDVFLDEAVAPPAQGRRQAEATRDPGQRAVDAQDGRLGGPRDPSPAGARRGGGFRALHPGGQRPVRGVDPRPFASLGAADSERMRLRCVLTEGHPSCKGLYDLATDPAHNCFSDFGECVPFRADRLE